MACSSSALAGASTSSTSSVRPLRDSGGAPSAYAPIVAGAWEFIHAMRQNTTAHQAIIQRQPESHIHCVWAMVTWADAGVR